MALLLLIGIMHHVKVRAPSRLSLDLVHGVILAYVFALPKCGLFEAGSTRLTNSFRQRSDVFVVFFESIYAQQFPPQWGCNFRRMVFAQIPAMRIAAGGQWTYYGGGLRVGVGQRSYGWFAASGARASSKVVHAHRV